MFENAKWIQPERLFYQKTHIAPVFFKNFTLKKSVKSAVLHITGLGTYTAQINGQWVTDTEMNPGCVQYPHRHQYQSFDVTDLVAEQNRLEVVLASGWLRGWAGDGFKYRLAANIVRASILAQLDVTYTDGATQQVVTDLSWTCSESKLRYSTHYNGETYDASFPYTEEPVAYYAQSKKMLIPQDGETMHVHETFAPVEMFTTPNGETVLDFGQEITGVVEFSLCAKAGDKVELSCAEVLDAQGNFYTENYRGARSKIEYTCCDGQQSFRPRHTFYGFRYIRLDAYPGTPDPNSFKALAIYSDMPRTGWFNCSNSLLNRWYQNSVWSQKGNFVDIPTDCPQRDERLGWLGDIQAFIRAAAYHFDVEKFMRKWMRDIGLAQRENGCLPDVVPDVWPTISGGTAGWGDAVTICPWQVYQAYGDPAVLEENYPAMKKWVDYVTETTQVPYAWIGQNQLGDWLGLDAEEGSFNGASNNDILASAYYAKSVQILANCAKLLGKQKDAEVYAQLYRNILQTFQTTYNDTFTYQAEHAVAIEFGLCKNPQKVADDLAAVLRRDGCMKTGFMGTPVLLHALSNYGYGDLAWDLMLREEYPSWLYAVTKGATTIWEHLDGIKPDGSFWSKHMNSFNHYAYGAAADWLYGVAGGITPTSPGYKTLRVAPLPTKKLEHLSVELDTRQGKVTSAWQKTENGFAYQITVPVEAEIVINGQTHKVTAGSYTYES